MPKTKAVCLLVLLGSGVGACSDGSGPAPACTLPKDPQFQFATSELQPDQSNSDCPEFSAGDLDAQLLTDAEVCVQSVDSCSVVLNCQLEGITASARLYDREGQLRGNVEVTSPLVCTYRVTAKYL